MVMYADMILLPIYLQKGHGFTAFDAGLLLVMILSVAAFVITLFMPMKPILD
jgi:hypothetical protein